MFIMQGSCNNNGLGQIGFFQVVLYFALMQVSAQVPETLPLCSGGVGLVSYDNFEFYFQLSGCYHKWLRDVLSGG